MGEGVRKRVAVLDAKYKTAYEKYLAGDNTRMKQRFQDDFLELRDYMMFLCVHRSALIYPVRGAALAELLPVLLSKSQPEDHN